MAKTETPLDPETGFPEVPEGYYWKVKDFNDNWLGHYIVLDLMESVTEKKFWRGVVQVEYCRAESSILYREFADATPEERRLALLGLADKIMEKRAERLYREAQKKDIENLLGTYPPKKLES